MKSSEDVTVSARLFDPAQPPTQPSNEVALLRRMVAERDALLLEAAHRSRNQLQLVVSLLGLEAANHADSEIGTVLRDMAERVAAVDLVNCELAGIPRRAVDFAASLSTLCSHLDRAFGKVARVELAAGAGECQLDVGVATHVALILNEIVTNALKHAFPNGRGGRAVVQLDRREGTCVLTVRDDGVGFAGDHPAGTGTHLLVHLVARVGGRLERNSGPEGTTFTLFFPLDRKRGRT